MKFVSRSDYFRNCLVSVDVGGSVFVWLQIFFLGTICLHFMTERLHIIFLNVECFDQTACALNKAPYCSTVVSIF